MAVKHFSQIERIALAGVSGFILYMVKVWATETWRLSLGVGDAWFWTGSITVLATVALQEPLFATPADACVNAIATIFALRSVQIDDLGLPMDQLRAANHFRAAGVSLGAGVLVIALVAIGTRATRFASLSIEIMRVAAATGQATVLGSFVYLYTVFVAYGTDVDRYPILLAVWIVVIVVQLVPRAWATLRRSRSMVPHRSGSVVGVRSPGLAFVRVPTSFPTSSSISIAGIRGSASVLERRNIGGADWILACLQGDEVPALEARVNAAFNSAQSNRPVGMISAHSAIDEIRIWMPLGEKRVSVGDSVRVLVRDQSVLYQIVGAQAVEDPIVPNVSLGFLSVQAVKIGSWSAVDRAFGHVAWLPQLGEPVYPADQESDFTISSDIGCVLGTRLGVAITPSELVTHNTAVLGMLGSGKSRLAMELVKRTLMAGSKAIVIDSTGQYGTEFLEQCPTKMVQEVLDYVTSETHERTEKTHKDRHRGGSINAFQRAVTEVVDRFLDSDATILVLDPTDFVISRQAGDLKTKKVGDKWEDHAALEKLTPPSIVSVIAETCLEQCQARGEIGSARLVLVLEEAHLLVPEWNSVSVDGDRNAVNATAKAIMQGRKFGFGTLVVAQRTANVSKSILSQCHSIFALRMNDRTGMDFLSGQFGPAHLDVLPQLADRVAIACGRSIATRMPVIVELNDSMRFDSEVWQSEVTAPGASLVPEQDPSQTA